MPVLHRSQKPSDERRRTDALVPEPLNQDHHPPVLLIDHVARLLLGREFMCIYAEAVRAADFLPSAADGAVVAG